MTVARFVGVRVKKMVAPPPSGARQLPCAECHEMVWISPTSFSMAQAKNWEVEPLCMDCMPKSLREGYDLKPFSAAQMEEVKKTVPSATDRDLRLLSLLLTGKLPEDG